MSGWTVAYVECVRDMRLRPIGGRGWGVEGVEGRVRRTECETWRGRVGGGRGGWAGEVMGRLLERPAAGEWGRMEECVT